MSTLASSLNAEELRRWLDDVDRAQAGLAAFRAWLLHAQAEGAEPAALGEQIKDLWAALRGVNVVVSTYEGQEK